jgi:hypothetical protein
MGALGKIRTISDGGESGENVVEAHQLHRTSQGALSPRSARMRTSGLEGTTGSADALHSIRCGCGGKPHSHYLERVVMRNIIMPGHALALKGIAKTCGLWASNGRAARKLPSALSSHALDCTGSGQDWSAGQ